jgi:hypothetical protein
MLETGMTVLSEMGRLYGELAMRTGILLNGERDAMMTELWVEGTWRKERRRQEVELLMGGIVLESFI